MEGARVGQGKELRHEGGRNKGHVVTRAMS